ncbi:hypothetical protein BHE74_00037006 [Ensete ventricosum]|nr:hypothetical protein BHE74_00037006 [Ensete ventricosum]
MFPITYPSIWEFYKKAVASFWTVEEVDLSLDLCHWQHRLTPDELHFVSHVLAFFATSDGLVIENLTIAIENIHSEMPTGPIAGSIPLAPLPSTLWPSLASRASSSPTPSALSSGSRNVASCPASPSPTNSFSCDEGLHCDFACLLRNKLSGQSLRTLLTLNGSFFCDALPVTLVEMNGHLMSQYIEFVADRLLRALGYGKMYRAANPFDWMELISLQGKANFFEKRVGEYQKASAMSSLNGTEAIHVFKLDEDF